MAGSQNFGGELTIELVRGLAGILALTNKRAPGFLGRGLAGNAGCGAGNWLGLLSVG